MTMKINQRLRSYFHKYFENTLESKVGLMVNLMVGAINIVEKLRLVKSVML